MRAITLLLAAGASAAFAAPLNPGTVQFPAASSAAPGGSLVDSSTSEFTAPGFFSGSLLSQVYSNAAGNPFGGLTFVYTLTNDGVGGQNRIGRLTVDGYSGWSADGFYVAPVTGVAPSQIDRSTALAGDVIGFSLQPSQLDPLANFLGVGQSTTQLVVHTNALNFTRSEAFVIDGSVAEAVALAPVPEPATLLGLGLMALLGRRKSR